jgi:hypothetical protein
MQPRRRLPARGRNAITAVIFLFALASREIPRRARGRWRAMARATTLAALVILSAAIAVTGTACEQNYEDIHFGTDAGAGFDAPVREASVDGGAGADAGGSGDDAAAGDDAGASADGG